MLTYLDEKGEKNILKGIPRHVSIGEILVVQLKICFKKGCHLYETHVEEIQKCKGPSVE